MEKLHEKDSFPIYLPSDSSSNLYPSNKASSYRTQLADSFVFNHRKECAVSEIIIPEPDVIKIEKPKIHLVWCFSYYKNILWSEWNFKERRILSIEINNEFEEDVTKIANIINESRKNIKLDKKILFDYFQNKRIMRFQSDFDPNKYDLLPPEYEVEVIQDELLHGNQYIGNVKARRGFFNLRNVTHWQSSYSLFWQFDDRLNKMLGIFDEFKLETYDRFETHRNDIPNRKRLIGTPRPFEPFPGHYWSYKYDFTDLGRYTETTLLSIGTFNDIKLKQIFSKKKLDLYILCDIINNSYVNDEKRRILRYSHIDCKGETVIKFDPLIYIPVICDEFDSLNIEILDEKFNNFKFKEGNIIVTLLFRNIEHI